jgi:hypothetical protein
MLYSSKTAAEQYRVGANRYERGVVLTGSIMAERFLYLSAIF